MFRIRNLCIYFGLFVMSAHGNTDFANMTTTVFNQESTAPTPTISTATTEAVTPAEPLQISTTQISHDLTTTTVEASSATVFVTQPSSSTTIVASVFSTTTIGDSTTTRASTLESSSSAVTRTATSSSPVPVPTTTIRQDSVTTPRPTVEPTSFFIATSSPPVLVSSPTVRQDSVTTQSPVAELTSSLISRSSAPVPVTTVSIRQDIVPATAPSVAPLPAAILPNVSSATAEKHLSTTLAPSTEITVMSASTTVAMNMVTSTDSSTTFSPQTDIAISVATSSQATVLPTLTSIVFAPGTSTTRASNVTEEIQASTAAASLTSTVSSTVPSTISSNTFVFPALDDVTMTTNATEAPASTTSQASTIPASQELPKLPLSTISSAVDAAVLTTVAPVESQPSSLLQPDITGQSPNPEPETVVVPEEPTSYVQPAQELPGSSGGLGAFMPGFYGANALSGLGPQGLTSPDSVAMYSNGFANQMIMGPLFNMFGQYIPFMFSVGAAPAFGLMGR